MVKIALNGFYIFIYFATQAEHKYKMEIQIQNKN